MEREHFPHHVIKPVAEAIWKERTDAYGPDTIDMADNDWYTAEKILRQQREDYREVLS